MKKTAALILFCVFLFALCACNREESKIPAGMKLATNNAAGLANYALFVPERWIVDLSTDRLTRAHVSETDPSFVSLTVCDRGGMPSGQIWMEDYLETTGTMIVDTPTVAKRDQPALLDGGDLAAPVYEYTAKIGETVWHVMQAPIYRTAGEHVIYLFTYMAPADSYDTYLDDANRVLETMTFAYDFGGTPIVFEDEKAPEGMKLASDRAVVGYSMYIPEDWIPVVACGASVAKAPAGKQANVSVMEWNVTAGIRTTEAWWEDYEKQLKAAFGDGYVLTVTGRDTFGGEESFAVRYRVTVDGVDYEYYQVVCVRDAMLYQYTYTAVGDDFQACREAADAILASFVF